MNILKTTLNGCLLFQPVRFDVRRGYFQELFRHESYKEAGIAEQLVQDNWSRSIKGGLRGRPVKRKAP